MSVAVLIAGILAASDPGVVSARPVAELIGRPVSQAAAAMGATRDPEPALSIVEDGSRLDLYPVAELMPVSPPNLRCDAVVIPPSLLAQLRDSPTPLYVSSRHPAGYRRIASVYVAARDGEIVSILNPPRAEAVERRAGDSDRDHLRRVMQENRDPWLAIAPGRLPLSDGGGFLARRGDLAAPSDAVLTQLCDPAIIRPSPAPPVRDDAGLFQGLSLLPFAWRLSGLNAERDANRREGPALLASLKPGEGLPGGLSGFLAAHPAVRRYVDQQDPGYSVLAINLGALASNNLARMNGAALVGVRDDRIVWLADGEAAGGLGLTSALCVDERRTARAVRPGCSDTGYFSP